MKISKNIILILILIALIIGIAIRSQITETDKKGQDASAEQRTYNTVSSGQVIVEVVPKEDIEEDE